MCDGPFQSSGPLDRQARETITRGRLEALSFNPGRRTPRGTPRIRSSTLMSRVSEGWRSVPGRLTENVPVVWYTCRGICSFDVLPSPKSHVNDNGSPSGSLAPAAENAIGVAACRPVEGDADKA